MWLICNLLHTLLWTDKINFATSGTAHLLCEELLKNVKYSFVTFLREIIFAFYTIICFIWDNKYC